MFLGGGRTTLRENKQSFFQLRLERCKREYSLTRFSLVEIKKPTLGALTWGKEEWIGLGLGHGWRRPYEAVRN